LAQHNDSNYKSRVKDNINQQLIGSDGNLTASHNLESVSLGFQQTCNKETQNWQQIISNNITINQQHKGRNQLAEKRNNQLVTKSIKRVTRFTQWHKKHQRPCIAWHSDFKSRVKGNIKLISIIVSAWASGNWQQGNTRKPTINQQQLKQQEQ